MAMKHTWQPKKLKRIRKHGYRSRSQTRLGKLILKRRRLKGRTSLAVAGRSK